MESNIGEVYVAAENQEIVDDVKQNGGQAILTSDNHKTGTDRVYEAVKKLGKSNIELVMNLQGDEPLMNTDDVRNLHKLMIKTKSRFGTLASNIIDNNLHKAQNVVKVITEKSLNNFQFVKAINFVRKSTDQKENTYHHLGIYCHQLETLENFVTLNQSKNEIENKLEQLRALDNNIKINVSLAKESPIGVDTEEDYVAIKKIMEYKPK